MKKDMIPPNATFKLKLIQGLIWALILFPRCTDTGKQSPENVLADQKAIHLLIKSPFSCFTDIKIDKKGAGVSIVGFPKGNKGDTIVGKKDFVIHSEKDMTILKRTIDSMVAKPLINRIPMEDGHRFILEIDNRTVLDRYGQDSLLNNFLTVLLPYVENPGNGQCDFFNLYKKSFK